MPTADRRRPFAEELRSFVVIGVLCTLAFAALYGLLDTAAAVTSGLAATAVRYVLMRGWVFRAGPAPEGGR